MEEKGAPQAKEKNKRSARQREEIKERKKRANTKEWRCEGGKKYLFAESKEGSPAPVSESKR
jgi:hypothetical protein